MNSKSHSVLSSSPTNVTVPKRSPSPSKTAWPDPKQWAAVLKYVGTPTAEEEAQGARAVAVVDVAARLQRAGRGGARRSRRTDRDRAEPTGD